MAITIEEFEANCSERRPRLLLHSCCGPCSSYVLLYLLQFFDVDIFFYNPNIDTESEYRKRFKNQEWVIKNFNGDGRKALLEKYFDLDNDNKSENTASALARMQKIGLVPSVYDHSKYLTYVSGLEKEKEGAARCVKCFEIRMSETARIAKELGYDYFTTTLSVSPHKNSKLLNEIGLKLEQEYGITYLESNFKKKNGYLISTKISKELGLYRQNYCGCEFAKGHLKEEIKMDKKLRVGILGATGMVGQRFISLLENHPWFEVVTVAASPRSAGKTYEDAVGDRWKIENPMPESVKKLVVMDIHDIENVASTVDFVFSAVDLTKEEIREIEDAYAKTETPVVSNNSAHRWTPDVPMVVPEINPEHFDVIEFQKKRLGTKRGFVAVKPNCSIQSYAPVLTAWKEFEPTEVIATTYQAISGAGKNFKDWPEMVENIIPYIGGEEKKSEDEPLRLWGKIEDGVIVKAQSPKISVQCVRVPVLNGHTAAVFVKFAKKPTKEQLIEKLNNFKGLPQELELPTAPKQFIKYMEEDDRPQVKADVMYENGMGVTVGRLREDTIYDFKFIGLSHNTVRGAAGGAILCAETLVAKKYIQAK